MTMQKQQVVALLKSLENGALGPAEVLSSTGFVQHKLDIANGVQGVRDLNARCARGRGR
jgi:hypothetical protein